MPQELMLIPESAPFTDEQRAWLNGFLAGWIGLQTPDQVLMATGVQLATSSGAMPGEAAPAAMEEEFPWHDPGLAIDERLQMAEGRPLARKLMAAMAQLNCGSCGYDCRKYAEAIASGEEQSLKLCSPGGKDTAKALKQLVQLESPAASNGHPKSGGADGGPEKLSAWTRQNPFPAKILQIRNLNGSGSSKFTSHVEIDLTGSGLTYDVGDSLGVYPTNCDELVQDLLNAISANGNEDVEFQGQMMSSRQALRDRCCLSEITDELILKLSERCINRDDEAALRQLLDNADPIDGCDVLDLLRQFPAVPLSPADLVAALSPLKPRLYSISSSLKAHPNQVHLTVGRVGWTSGTRVRKGVASTMFADRLEIGSNVHVFVQKSHGFTVPATHAADVIMIGPGTGIAPFRAFLQERHAIRATGRNWLFFGDQRAATDSLYADELAEYQEKRVLHRLSLAFSRDQEAKIYVQTRMQEEAAEFWNWLEQGAHVYVCGDARRMARDVDLALKKIIAEFGRMSQTSAEAYVVQMTRDKRYCRDVY